MQNKRFTLTDGVFILVWALPLAYLWYVYASLPARVPLHFGIQGRPDRYGSPKEFLRVIFVLQGVSVLAFLLIRYLPEIDPKKRVQYSRRALTRIGHAMVLFLSVLSLFMIFTTVKGYFAVDAHFIFVAVALLIAYMGNLMNSIKPNYFVGIRTPWTLENETVWRKTHQMGGRLFLVGGLLLAVILALVTGRTALWIYLCGMAVLVLVPVIYSYVLFKKIVG